MAICLLGPTIYIYKAYNDSGVEDLLIG